MPILFAHSEQTVKTYFRCQPRDNLAASEHYAAMKPPLYLKQYRLRAKMTVAKLAEASGWSGGYISEVENQKKGKQYTQAFIQDMATALGVSVGELLEIDPNHPNSAINHTHKLPSADNHALLLKPGKRSVPVSYELNTRGWTVAGVSHPAMRDFAYIDDAYTDIDVTSWPIKDRSINKINSAAAYALTVPLSARPVGDGSLVVIQRKRTFEGVVEIRALIRLISVGPDGAISYVTASDDPELQEAIPRDDDIWMIAGVVFDLRSEFPLPSRPISFN